MFRHILTEANEALDYIYCLLVEASIKDYKQRYPEFSSQIDLAVLLGLQQKWFPLLIRNLQNNIETEEFADLTQRFDKLIPKMNKEYTDVGYWQKKSYREFQQFIFELERAPSISQQQDIERALASGAKKIYEDGQYVVFKLRSYKDICALGTNTSWCITQKKHWLKYTKEDDAFFIVLIDKNNLQPLTRHVTDDGRIQYRVPREGKICVQGTKNELKYLAYDAWDQVIHPSKLEVIFPMWQEILEKHVLSPTTVYFKKLGGVLTSSGWEFRDDLELSNINIKTFPKISKINGDVWLSNLDVETLDFLPAKITGDLSLTSLHNLITLKNGPSAVNRNFKCRDIYFPTLEGMPEIVGGSIVINANEELQSLSGCPKSIGINFDLSHLRMLKSLAGGPKNVEGRFTCVYTGIKTLKGFPYVIGGNIDLYSNSELESLVDCVEGVTGNFSISDCVKLKSLAGCPKRIAGNFFMKGVRLDTFDYFPEYVGGNIYGEFLDPAYSPGALEKILSKCEVKGKINGKKYD